MSRALLDTAISALVGAFEGALTNSIEQLIASEFDFDEFNRVQMAIAAESGFFAGASSSLHGQAAPGWQWIVDVLNTGVDTAVRKKYVDGIPGDQVLFAAGEAGMLRALVESFQLVAILVFERHIIKRHFNKPTQLQKALISEVKILINDGIRWIVDSTYQELQSRIDSAPSEDLQE